MKRRRAWIAALIALASVLPMQAPATGTAFTYQGRLLEAGEARTGTIDLRFDLYELADGGDASNFDAPVVLDGVPLAAGVFTVQVDFGPAIVDLFDGRDLFVQVGLREDGAGDVDDPTGFTFLLPRQPVTIAPYAQFARRIGNDAIDGQQIIDGSIPGTDLQPGAVTSLVSNTTDLRFGLQRRVVGACAGERAAIRAIAADGSIACAYFDPPAAIAPLTLDADADVGEFVSIASAGARVAMAYYDRANGRLKFTTCTADLCPATPPRVIDDPVGGDTGRFASIALDAAGLPRIAYYDAAAGDLRLALCADVDCSGTVVLRTLDSGGDVGRHASIGVGNAGRVAVAYHDATQDAYKVALCANAACSSHGVATLEGFSGGGVDGSAIALQIGAGGSPRIALLDGGTQLRMIRCSAPCDRADTIATLDGNDSRAPIALLRAPGPISDSSLPLWVGYTDAFARVRFVQCDADDCGGEPNLVPVGTATAAVGGTLALSPKPEGTPLALALSSGGSLQAIDFASRAATRVPNPLVGAASAFVGVAHFGDGQAAIVYHDEGAGALRYQRCARADCSDQ